MYIAEGNNRVTLPKLLTILLYCKETRTKPNINKHKMLICKPIR